MKKIVIFISLLSLLFIAQSCSYSYGVFIVNRSAEPLTIIYEVLVVNSDNHEMYNTKPDVYDINPEKDDLEIAGGNAGGILKDSTMKVTAVLKPNQALKVGYIDYFNKQDTVARKLISANAKYLKIISGTDTLYCPANLIPDLFNKDDDGNVVYNKY